MAQDSTPATPTPLPPLPHLKGWETRLLATAERAERLYRHSLLASGKLKIDHLPTDRGQIHSLRFEPPRENSAPTGSPLYFIHGYNAVASQWIPIAGKLSARHTSHAPDLLGHGLSEPPETSTDFHHAIDESLNQHFLSSISDREPGILIGNSLGGWLAIRLALAFPERVKGLVLISPAGAPMAMDKYKDFFGTFRFERAAEAAQFFKNLHGTSRLRSLGGLRGFLAETGHHTLGTAIGPLVHALFRRPWIEALPRLTESSHFLTPADLAKLKMPILFIWGKQEKIMLPEMREWYRSHLPRQTEFVEPETFGHCPQLDRPEELTAMIEEFCARV